MAYKTRNGLEELAKSVLNMNFSEMWRLAQYIESCSNEEGEKDAVFFAHVLIGFSEEVDERYNNRDE